MRQLVNSVKVIVQQILEHPEIKANSRAKEQKKNTMSLCCINDVVDLEIAVLRLYLCGVVPCRSVAKMNMAIVLFD